MTGALRWGVKQSLHDYVRSSEGTIEAGDGARLDGDDVVFPADGSLEGAFTGFVRFVAHGGLMDWLIAQPRLDENGTRLTLAGRRGARVPFATIGEEGVRLTVDGSLLLGSFYPPGTALAPLRVELSDLTRAVGIENR